MRIQTCTPNRLFWATEISNTGPSNRVSHSLKSRTQNDTNQDRLTDHTGNKTAHRPTRTRATHGITYPKHMYDQTAYPSSPCKRTCSCHTDRNQPEQNQDRTGYMIQNQTRQAIKNAGRAGQLAIPALRAAAAN